MSHILFPSLPGYILDYIAFTNITINTNIANGRNWTRNPPNEINLALKNIKKHNLIMSQFRMPYALISREFNAYATCEWQLSQHILCIRVRYSAFASIIAWSHLSAPPGRELMSIFSALVGRPNAFGSVQGYLLKYEYKYISTNGEKVWHIMLTIRPRSPT